MGFFAKKLLTSLVLPPGIFIIVLAFGGMYLLVKRRRIGSLFVLSAFLLYALSIGPVKDHLMRPLEDAHQIPDKVKGDVIIMLGGGVYDGAPDPGGKGIPSEDAVERLVCSYRLWRSLQVPVIISGGSLAPGKPAEAGIVGRVLSDMGLPEKYIIEERKSRDTAENSSFVKEILEKRRFRSPVLVTSAYHMKRAVLSFRKRGIAVTPFPCGYRTDRTGYDRYDFLPGPAPLHHSAVALKEYLGIAVAEVTDGLEEIVK